MVALIMFTLFTYCEIDCKYRLNAQGTTSVDLKKWVKFKSLF